MSPCKFSEHNFTIRGRFFPKNANIAHNISGLATSGRHNYTMITDRGKFTTKWSLYVMSSFHFLPLESIQNHSYAMYAPYKKATPTLFGNVQRPFTSDTIRLTVSVTWLRHQVITRSFNKITRNWVMHCMRRIVMRISLWRTDFA